tara:strand:+ start:1184 stop:1333 length:150 start_codon:yes stop_codon:yes gene_type:complete
MQALNIGLYKTQYDHKPLFLYVILDGIGLGEIRFWLGWQEAHHQPYLSK